MISTPVRILLIISLATWSPAWCCCAVRAMAAGEDATTQHSCCSRSVSPQQERSDRSCCTHAESKCCESGGDEPPCRCADRIIEQQRLDTAVKVAAPRLDLQLPAAPVTHEVSAAAAHFIDSTANLRCWHPPPRTLLAQSCLLLL